MAQSFPMRHGVPLMQRCPYLFLVFSVTCSGTVLLLPSGSLIYFYFLMFTFISPTHLELVLVTLKGTDEILLSSKWKLICPSIIKCNTFISFPTL